MAEYQAVAGTAELGPGQIQEAEVQGEPVMVVNIGQTYYALSARCPYDDTNLAREGNIDGELIVCPTDGRSYDLRSGESTRRGDVRYLERYAIRVENNEVKVGPRLPHWQAGAA